MKASHYTPSIHWQSWAVATRHLRVLLLNWHTALVPPIAEPVVLLLAFGVGLGSQMEDFTWNGERISYLTYLAPGILAYTSFMMAFFQSLFSAFMRMHYQRTWEGQLTTQVRLEHVIWGEALWAASLATFYVVVMCIVLMGFGLGGTLTLQWTWMVAVVPILFLGSLSFAFVGLFFTATLPSMDHMGLPFFLVIMPIGFASGTYFPLPDVPWLHLLAEANPLYHLANGGRRLLIDGVPTWHLPKAMLICLGMLLVLVPIVKRKLRRRVFGEN
ncbi:MAG: ABC transporter permease [Verrucomicrobiota bacterium]